MSAAPAALSSAHFALLQRVIRTVARSNRLNPEDAEDFGQSVHLKLLERNYDVFDSFEGRASLTTFLTVVVSRLLLDWRNATRGKWRPAAATARLGEQAIALERLMHRDGLTRDEAIATLASRVPTRRRQDAEATYASLAHLADRLPTRTRRTFVRDVADELLGQLEFDDPVAARELQAEQRAVRRALHQACARLTATDRQLLALRYGRARTVRAIGDELKTDPKPLYRRLERVLKTLRHDLIAMGIDAGSAQQLMSV